MNYETQPSNVFECPRHISIIFPCHVVDETHQNIGQAIKLPPPTKDEFFNSMEDIHVLLFFLVCICGAEVACRMAYRLWRLLNWVLDLITYFYDEISDHLSERRADKLQTVSVNETVDQNDPENPRSVAFIKKNYP